MGGITEAVRAHVALPFRSYAQLQQVVEGTAATVTRSGWAARDEASLVLANLATEAHAYIGARIARSMPTLVSIDTWSAKAARTGAWATTEAPTLTTSAVHYSTGMSDAIMGAVRTLRAGGEISDPQRLRALVFSTKVALHEALHEAELVRHGSYHRINEAIVDVAAGAHTQDFLRHMFGVEVNAGSIARMQWETSGYRWADMRLITLLERAGVGDGLLANAPARSWAMHAVEHIAPRDQARVIAKAIVERQMVPEAVRGRATERLAAAIPHYVASGTSGEIDRVLAGIGARPVTGLFPGKDAPEAVLNTLKQKTTPLWLTDGAAWGATTRGNRFVNKATWGATSQPGRVFNKRPPAQT